MSVVAYGRWRHFCCGAKLAFSWIFINVIIEHYWVDEIRKKLRCLELWKVFLSRFKVVFFRWNGDVIFVKIWKNEYRKLVYVSLIWECVTKFLKVCNKQYTTVSFREFGDSSVAKTSSQLCPRTVAWRQKRRAIVAATKLECGDKSFRLLKECTRLSVFH